MVKQEVLDENINVYEIELLALLECLKIAIKNSIIYSDSNQVITEVNGEKKPKNLESVSVAKSLMEEKNIRVIKIGRDDNIAGIYLEKRLLTLKKSRDKVLNPSKKSVKSKKQKTLIYIRKK